MAIKCQSKITDSYPDLQGKTVDAVTPAITVCSPEYVNYKKIHINIRLPILTTKSIKKSKRAWQKD